jgi:DNA-binding transcriptional ArsR family regulator
VATKTKFNPQSVIDEQVENIDEALETIERRMKPYEALAEKKQQLLSARRALLGHGPRTTGGTSTRLHLEDIIQHLKEHPGSSPGQVAEMFGVSQTTVSSHLYRNKDRFVSKDGRYWNRDPKAGINTADDIEEDED